MTSTMTEPITDTVVTTHGELSTALKAARTAIPTHHSVTALVFVLIESGPDGLALTGTDWESFITYQVNTDPSPEFRVTVKAAQLAKFLGSLTKGSTAAKMARTPVVLTRGADTLSVESDGYTCELPIGVTDDYPPSPIGVVQGGALMDAKALRDGIEAVAVTAGTDDYIAALTALQVLATPTGVTLACTDRYRMAVQPLEARNVTSFTAMPPAKALLAASKLLPEGPVHLELLTSGHLRVIAGPVTATIRVIDAQFPKWASLFPSDCRTRFTIEQAAVTKAVTRVATATGKATAYGVVRMRVMSAQASGSDAVQFTAGGTEDGTVTSPLVLIDGDVTEALTGFTPAYLLDGLNLFTGTMAIGMTAPGRPIVLAASLEELTSGAGLRYLLMPSKN